MKELRRIRKDRGLSQKRLGELSGVGEATIADAERGRHIPRLQTLEKLAGVLDVEVADFFPKAQSPLPGLDEENEALVCDLMQRVKADELSVFDALDAMRARGILQPRRQRTAGEVESVRLS
jgi:transcriptional regulator with XRE-family HTH domain